MGLYWRSCLAAVLGTGCLAAPADPAGGDETCGSLLALSEEFGGGPPSGWRWSPDGLWDVDEGALLLTPDTGEVSALYSGQAWSVARGELVVHFALEAMEPDSSLQVILSGAEGAISLTLAGPALRVDVDQPDASATRDTVDFSGADMNWWRVARVDDHFRWWTSGDGESWTEQGDFDAALSGLASVAVIHYAGDVSSQVGIEAINPGGASETACPIAGFQDGFTQASPRWQVLGDPSCDVEFDDGVAIGDSAIDVCGVVSSERFSLEDDQVTIELRDAGDCQLDPTFQVRFATGDFSFSCTAEGGPPRLYALHTTDDSTEDMGDAAWDPDLHRFLRFRHSRQEGALIYETSPDGADWNGLGAVTDLDEVDLRSVEVWLVAYSEIDTEQRIVFDQLNILP